MVIERADRLRASNTHIASANIFDRKSTYPDQPVHRISQLSPYGELVGSIVLGKRSRCMSGTVIPEGSLSCPGENVGSANLSGCAITGCVRARVASASW